MGLKVDNETLNLTLDTESLTHLAKVRNVTVEVRRDAKYFRISIETDQAIEPQDEVLFSYVEPDGFPQRFVLDEDSIPEAIEPPNNKKTHQGSKSKRDK